MKLFTLRFATILSIASIFAPGTEGKHTRSRSRNATWYEDDTTVTLVPKFKIKEGMREQYVALLPQFIELVKENEEEGCVFYGFVGPTEDDYVICREGYISGEAVLYHLENVGDVLNEALQYADIVDLMVQGPAAELEKLKEPLAGLAPAYYPLTEGSIMAKPIC
eukprot:CAMPEP_0172481574 /NCGR_PEP_ID=MMETSP1066-20121228/7563_1 /TAXON_ID=671091 /ORGANISM="Coscinodiscus wailesii, Strain CCMP2513" /LENGTH=164 /DNA_ID=CAMNT_0013244003 /DNA_START=159 /DNA_END=653 /DNA_ORIENTATION=+